MIMVGKDFSFQVEKLLCNTLQYHSIRLICKDSQSVKSREKGKH